MKTIGELFTSLPNGAAVSSAIAQGEITKVNIHNEVRLVTLWVTFGSLINRDELIAAEKLFSSALDASVIIKPYFGEKLFTADYFPQLYAAVKREIPSINGTLNNAEVQFDGEALTITLQNGGKAILEAKRFDEILLRYIREEFGLNLRVNYTGTFEASEQSDEYRQVMQSAKKQQEREQLQKGSRILQG